MQEQVRFILMYVVFPMWVAAGLADWAHHRVTGIAYTSGLKENLLHWLMFIEIGVGMAAVALLEINAAILLLVLAVFIVHQLTVYWDLDYSTVRRDVGPGEQMVHSFLELLPLLSLALLALVAWPQVLAVFNLGPESPNWELLPKAEPWPPGYLMAALAAIAVFNALPLLQETWSCVRARRGKAPAGARARPRLEPKLEPESTARTPPSPGPR
jgi:hypothetical protein